MGLFCCVSPGAFDVPHSDVPTGQTPSKSRIKLKKDKSLREEDGTCSSVTCPHAEPLQREPSTGSISHPSCSTLSSTTLQTPIAAPSRKSHISSLFSLSSSSSSPSTSSHSSSRSSSAPRPVVVHLSMIGRGSEVEIENKPPKRPARPRLGRSLTAPPAAHTLDEKYISFPTLLAQQASSPKGRKRALSTASVSGPPCVRSRTLSRPSESKPNYVAQEAAVSIPSSNSSTIVFQMDFDRPEPLAPSRSPSITSATAADAVEPTNTLSSVQNGLSHSRIASVSYLSYDYDHPEFELPPLSADATITPDLISVSSFDKSNLSFDPSPESSPELSWFSKAQPGAEQTSPERRLAALAALIMDVPTPRTSSEMEDPMESMIESERFDAEQYSVGPVVILVDSSEEKGTAFEPEIQSWASSTSKTMAHKPRAMIKNVNGLKAEWRKNREAATWGEELTWEFIKAVNEGR